MMKATSMSPYRDVKDFTMPDGVQSVVIDPDTLKTVGPGGIGELVLTNLGRLGSPLLRYRTGDVVRRAWETACPCGSEEMALEGGIVGRADDMVVVRGVNLYPSAVEDVVRELR